MQGVYVIFLLPSSRTIARSEIHPSVILVVYFVAGFCSWLNGLFFKSNRARVADLISIAIKCPLLTSFFFQVDDIHARYLEKIYNGTVAFPCSENIHTPDCVFTPSFCSLSGICNTLPNVRYRIVMTSHDGYINTKVCTLLVGLI